MKQLPRPIEQQLRATVPNRGRRKRMAKDIHHMLRLGNTRTPSLELSDRYEQLRSEGNVIPNRQARRHG